MAAPTININLTLIDDADDDSASWIPVGRSGQVTGEPDVYVQRDDASTTTFSQVTTLVVETELLAFDTGGAITFGEHEHLYAWLNFTAPAKLESTANGGQRIAFGDGSSGTAALSNYAQYYVGGNEAEFVSGGWRCYCASPTVTPQEGVVESTPISFAAGGRGAESVGKDNMFVDVMRYGRGLQLVDGDSANPGTMKSFTDENDLIMKKIAKAKTDPLPMPSAIKELNERPEINNLINIYSAFSGEKIEGVINKFEGKKLSEFKSDLCDVVINEMEPIRIRFKELKNDKTYLKKILHDGMLKAKEKSDPIINEVKSIVGLG